MQQLQEKPRRKAIALMSGGLDSTLAAKLIKNQGIDVIGLHLVSPFGCREDVQKSADDVGIPLLFKDKGASYLELVENPRYGYGKNMNPCIDCRIFMFQLADIIRQDEKADFIVTGEVVGQRPMSQQRHSMDIIDRKSPIDGLVVRPLSAQALPITIPEQEGWIKREELLGITGRGRRDQLDLAEKFGLKEFSKPGGGCLLTDASFSQRLKDFFAHKPNVSEEEKMAQSAMLRLGRHFRFSDTSKAIVARNDIENHELRKLNVGAKGQLFYPENFDGPVAILFGDLDVISKEKVGSLIARYGKSSKLNQMEIALETSSTPEIFCVTAPMTEEGIQQYKI